MIVVLGEWVGTVAEFSELLDIQALQNGGVLLCLKRHKNYKLK
jgi:hypothetical protein